VLGKPEEFLCKVHADMRLLDPEDPVRLKAITAAEVFLYG
jgi:hypothetical protein